jgi:hypothetical protein
MILGLGIGGLETDYLRPGERARESRRAGEPVSAHRRANE